MYFLGHEVAYWLELDRRFKSEERFGRAELLEEVVALRGRLDFYESRIKDMAKLAEQPL